MSIKLRPHQQRSLDALLTNNVGQVIFPTGGGKTLVGICDAMRRFSEATAPINIVVVAPRILLAEQLSSEYMEFITNASVMHVHSGETHHFSTTKAAEILSQTVLCGLQGKHQIIFTTYNSLNRVVEAGIAIDTIYYDEAHNSVQRNFFESVAAISTYAKRKFYFTATPKHSFTPKKPGMNNVDVYGKVIANVPAPELIDGGFIIPPQVVVQEMPSSSNFESVAERDCVNLINIITNNQNMDKVLVAAAKTKDLVALFSHSDFEQRMTEMGYHTMWITAKHGAIIDGKKVNREVFFDTLSAWGADDSKKFVVLHHSILAEGINVSGLTSCILMRNMDIITMAQTIGRVIRLHKNDAKRLRSGELKPGDLSAYTKAFGLVHVPVFSNVGISTAKRLQNVVDTIFTKGEAAISGIRR